MAEQTRLRARAQPTSNAQSYDGIQALRFLAALLVVVTHSFFYATERLDPLFGQWPYGGVGVDIFFVISGFVMVVSSQRRLSSRDGWKYFAVRRIVRIVPMYWIATSAKVAVMLALPGAALHASLSTGHVLASYFFLPTRNDDGRVEPLLGVGWTLTFEMFFYLVFGLGLFLYARKTIWIASAILAALFIGSFFRPSDWPVWAVYLDSIVLYFAIGMWIAKAATNAKSTQILLSIASVSTLIAVVGIATTSGLNLDPGNVQRFALVTLLVAVVVALEPIIYGRLPKAISFYGNASYSLYLFHPIVAPIAPVALGVIGLRIGWLSVVGSIMVALIAAAAIYRFVETPLTRKLREQSKFA